MRCACYLGSSSPARMSFRRSNRRVYLCSLASSELPRGSGSSLSAFTMFDRRLNAGEKANFVCFRTTSILWIL